MRQTTICDSFDGGKVFVDKFAGQINRIEVKLDAVLIRENADINLAFEQMTQRLLEAREIVKSYL